jgi:cyclopropane fatty-acyl-phospholipid synthase-like methyltransferase
VKINNALNIQDFERVWTLLQEILKEVEKMGKLIEKEGFPQHFLRCLKKVKDEIAEVDANAEVKKKMKKHSATAFNTMKQKFKKIYPEYEAAVEADLAKGEEESEQSEE